MPATLWTRAELARDLASLGIKPGDTVMTHAGLRSVGPILGGPDTLIGAIRDTVGPSGTLMAYTDWLWEDEWATDPELRAHAPAFDPQASRAIRDNGAFPEFLRTTPGALRSASPGPSCAAIGAKAEWLLADHALSYGYGERSPFARLVEAGGKVLLVGAPLDSMTLLHHAEHLADIPGKRIKRYETPFLENGEVVWRALEEFDTGNPIVEGLDDLYFADVVEDFLSTGQGKRGTIGAAPSVLVDAPAIVAFAVEWLERRFPKS